MAKKVFTVFLAAIVVLLPAIAGAVIYFMPDDLIQAPVNISGTLYDDEGAAFEFNRNKNAFLASFFDELYENSTPSVLDAETIRYDKSYLATVTEREKTESFTLYLSEKRSCYFSDSKGQLHVIDTKYANSLLSTPFAIGMYEKLHTPILTTNSKVTVLPSSTDFKYTIKDGSTQESDGLPTTSQSIVYYSSNTVNFKFSVDPDIFNLKVYVDDELRYSGAYYSFDSSSIPTNSTVKYEIDATWVKNTENNCFGTATYSFYVSYSPAPVFSVEKTSVNAGEFLLVSAKNILDPSRISCSFSKDLDIEPRFFKNGDIYYALIPLSHELDTDTYKLTLECGETRRSFNINVKARDQRNQKVDSDASSALTEKALGDMYSLISAIGSSCSSEIFDTEDFVNFEKDFSIRLGFAHLREFNDGTQFFLDGVDFYAESGEDVPAINSGIVCASGEDAILGKYIVIDHGYGLKSWYCNISEAAFSVGARVMKGEIVAKTGNSNFYGESGVYIMTTVLDVPVAPYALYENNFLLPEQKN